VDLGFEDDKRVVLQYDVSSNGYDESRGKSYHREIVERARALPGAAAATIASTLPLTPGFQRSVFPEGRPNQANNRGVLVQTNIIAPGYFDTLRIPLLRGRDFSEADREGQQAVVVINEAMARRFWPDEDAMGKQFRFFGEIQPRVIVGIARNAKYVFVGEDPQPMAYTPLAQGYSAAMGLIVRTNTRPDAL